MLEWLAVWGVATATASVFKPILERLATKVAEDIAKSYVKKCFSSVFSAFHQKPLAKATGLAVKKLLDLIEDEMLDADLSREQVAARTGDVQKFLDREEIATAIGALFLDPDYKLDPALFAKAWQRIAAGDNLPDGFSWERIAKRFAREVRDIRSSTGELKETFESLSSQQDSEALKELQGLPPGFDLETYREALIERYGNLDFASMDMTGAYYSDVRLWSVFVPQSVRECHEYDPQLLEVPKEHLERLVAAGELDAEQLAESEKRHEQRRQAYVNQPSRPVLEVVGEPTALAAGIAAATFADTRPTLARSAHRLVILGDPGSGKSSLLQFLALRWARIDDANLRYTQPLPLLIELRQYHRWECASGKGFAKYLHEASTWHRLNQQTLKHLLDQPDRVVLLLDGLDEVFDPVERERVVNDIHRFSNDYKHVRIVVTSRVVGYQPARLRNAEFRHFMLQDLDPKQIGHFLDKWHEVTFDKPEDAGPKRQRLDAAIKNSKSIAQLAGNPLLLTMMAILNRNQKLPDDRVDLYQQCSRLLLYQWDVEGKLLEEFPGLSAEIGLREKTDILRTVAYAMQTRMSDESRANYIDRQTLESLIEDYLHSELRFEQARAVARALVEQLRARNFILCYLGADSYAFVHRTFLEYFCAADIVHQFNVAKTLSEQDLIALFDAHCRDDDWREVLRLICGQIDEQFVGRIVEHLATRTDLEKWDGHTVLPEFALAIGCLSEVRNVEKLSDLGSKLLHTVVTFLNCAGDERSIGTRLNSFLHAEFLDAVRALGTRWPRKEGEFDPIEVAESMSEWAREVWPAFVLSVTHDRKILSQLATSKHVHLRPAAIIAIAENWPDDESRALLLKCTVLDDSGYSVGENDDVPRSIAIRMLSEVWRDELTREHLSGLAVNDADDFVRSSSLLALAKQWPNKTTLELLEAQFASFAHAWLRLQIGDAIESLQEKLKAEQPRSD